HQTKFSAQLVRTAKSTDDVHDEMKNLRVTVQKFREDVRTLVGLPSQRPKELGFFWETGRLENHVVVDDGLGPVFYLPYDLCSTPKVTASTPSITTSNSCR